MYSNKLMSDPTSPVGQATLTIKDLILPILVGWYHNLECGHPWVI